MFTLSGASCLVTEPIGFEAEQIPAHLSNPQPANFTRIPVTADPACVAVLPEGLMAFSVDVSDANVTETLEARLIINGERKDYVAVPATGNAARGTVTLCATELDLQRNCSHVEIAVSSQFKPGRDPYATIDPIDFSAEEWFVLKPAPSVPIAGQDDCSALIPDEAR